MASTPEWTLTQIGARSWNFAWPIGFYNTVFTVTDEGVVARDPINREAAAAYRAAIPQVTDQPIRYVVYSHDHLDHITGADGIQMTEAMFVKTAQLAVERLRPVYGQWARSRNGRPTTSTAPSSTSPASNRRRTCRSRGIS